MNITIEHSSEKIYVSIHSINNVQMNRLGTFGSALHRKRACPGLPSSPQPISFAKLLIFKYKSIWTGWSSFLILLPI